MRLGTETGSLVNHLHSRAVIGQPEPTVGMGATMLGWSDRHPGTIIEVFSIRRTKFIVVQADKYKRIDKNGMSESQEYEYTPDTEGAKYTFRIGRSGQWEEVYFNENKRWVKTSGQGLRIGEREKYYDFSF